MSKNITPKPETQVGGTHYSRLSIEPIQFIEANGLGYAEGNAVKYISRWRNKNGLEDLNKAKWYIERLIQVEEARIDTERREELMTAIAVNFGPGAPGSGDNPCTAPLCGCDETGCDSDLSAEAVNEDINDLHFFGWSDMKPSLKAAIIKEADRNGVTIVEQLQADAETWSGLDAIKWTGQS